MSDKRDKRRIYTCGCDRPDFYGHDKRCPQWRPSAIEQMTVVRALQDYVATINDLEERERWSKIMLEAQRRRDGEAS